MPLPLKYSSPRSVKQEALKRSRRTFKETADGALIYPSKLGKGVNLNGEGKDRHNDPIECRQLSGLAAFKNIKGYHRLLDNLESIEGEPYLANNDFDSTEHKISCYIAVSSIDSFGQTLENLAKQLTPNTQSSFLLFTENHGMALNIHHKKINQDDSHFIIKFYDPNITDSHTRAICPNLKIIGALTASDFLDAERLNAYFPKLQCFSVRSYEKCREAETPILYASQDENDAFLHFYLVSGAADKVKTLTDKILSDKQLTVNQRIEQLEAKNDDGFSGASRAFLLGHLSAVMSYVNSVLSSRLTSQQCFQLLNTCNADGLNSLDLALMHGQEQIVKWFTSTILKSRLSLEQKFKIIQGNGRGFLLALRYAHQKTVSIYMDIILNAPFCSNKKIILMEAKAMRGLQALYAALAFGHTHTVNTYMRKIINADFSLDQRFQLFQAQNKQHYSGLYAALLFGHLETAKAYIQNVCDAGLDPIQIHTLCTKEYNNDLPIKSLPFQRGSEAGFWKTPKEEKVKHYMEKLLKTIEATPQDETLSSSSPKHG
jgi:hypothetical protein